MTVIDRRTFLAAGGTTLAALLTGCQGSDEVPAPTTTPTNTASSTNTTTSQSPSTAKQRTRKFIALLDNGNFEQAYERLSPQARDAISVDELEAAWTGQEDQFGSYQSISALSTSEENDTTVVSAILTYTDGRLNAILTFTEDGIRSFQLRPVQGTWTPPEYVEEAAFTERSVTLSAPGQCSLDGTLTIPTSVDTAPGVVIVHGQGAMDRDGTFGPNKIYKDLAWGLASRGIAVLRYDKRSQACDVNMAEATIDDVVTDDALTAVEHLRATDIVPDSDVVVLGHSIGGTLAPRIAAQDGNLAGIVMLAALHRPVARAIMDQNEFLVERDGTVTDQEQRSLEQVQQLVERIRTLDIPDDETAFIGGDEYWRSLQEYDHDATAAGLSIPQLYLQGVRDYQVTVEDDLAAWKEALGHKQSVSFRTYEALNHHFMSGTGTPGRMEYFRENHVAEQVVSDLVSFSKEST